MSVLNQLRRMLLRRMRNSAIESYDSDLPHSVVIPVATYSPWRGDARFQATYRAIAGNTLVDIYRCYELWSLIDQSAKIPGDILEVGVWKGGTGCLMAARSKLLCGNSKHVFLCDTFAGVVKTSHKDTLYRGGEHRDAAPKEVVFLAESLELDNLTILPGVFPDQTASAIEGRRFSFCHIDVDAYVSAKDVFEWIAPRMELHGTIVFDDYGFLGCEGITRLVNELSGRRGFLSVSNLNGHAIMIKIAE